MALSTRLALNLVNLRWPLLRHSFYQRWTQGTLTMGELRYYSDQYRHLVVALPGWLSSAAISHPTRTEELQAHAREEAAHVELWDGFRQAIGATGAAAPANQATNGLIETGDALARHQLGAAAAWALEAQAPEVSSAKALGLATHYGVDSVSGVAYFRLHSRMDVAHASELESAIEELPAELKADAPDAADAVLSGIWDVLTSAEQLPAG